MTIIIEAITEENKERQKKAILTWLKNDFKKKKNPETHFWHNQDTISEAFGECRAIVALNESQEITGYMIWHLYGNNRAQIDIIEVKPDHRKKGIFKQMIDGFCDLHKDILLLTASVVVKESEIAFEKTGWKKIIVENGRIQYHKITVPVFEELTELPDGYAIAICRKDYYRVKDKLEDHRSSMRYFKIELDQFGEKLMRPLVANLGYDDYFAIYLNKVLLIDSKPKYTFENYPRNNFLVLSELAFEPDVKKILQEKGFFGSPEQNSLGEGDPRKRKFSDLFDENEKGNQSSTGEMKMPSLRN